MIKCEVMIDGDQMFVGGWEIKPFDVDWNDVGIRWVAEKTGRQECFKTKEQAIKYCMEQGK